MDKIREAGTTGSPKQDIAGLPSSALAPQEELAAFLIFLLDASHHPRKRWL